VEDVAWVIDREIREDEVVPKGLSVSRNQIVVLVDGKDASH
jgi:hypothetical protein